MPATLAKVMLVRWSPEPEQLIAAAAKLCYAENINNLFTQDPAKAGQFVQKLKNMGHLSPIEHAVFTFYIDGVSRAMSHQLVRHRLASYSQRSQRYVKHTEFAYVVPPALKGKTIKENDKKIDAEDYFKDTMEYIARRYTALVEALGNKGESSNEDARYILPNACETKLFMTMNARQLLHFFEERLCERAQWEIRQVTEKMLALVKEKCPALFSGVGPKCVSLGKCPEGKLSCGKFQQKKKQFGE
jgi:thymidylate synthase (FAD)